MIPKLFKDNTEDFEMIISNSYNKFDDDLSESQIDIVNHGAIKCEIFLYFLWLINKEYLSAIIYVENHKGVWEFHLSIEYEYILKRLRGDIIRTMNYNHVDPVSEYTPIFKTI